MASSQQHSLSKVRPYAEYQGIRFPTAIVQEESLDAMKTFEIRDDDVVIVSYPKSGINWMFEVVRKILGGKIGEKSLPIGPEFWPPEKQKPCYIELRESPSPRIMVTHLPYQLAPPGLAAAPVNKVKAIVILRNPKDVCVSSYYFHQKSPIHKTPESWAVRNKDFLAGKMPFGDYFDHVLGWWQMKDDPHFLFVKYEDMKKNFRSTVKTIAAFLEKELTDEHLALILNSCSLESMRKTLAESGMVGDWKNHFSAEESARFDQKYRERMVGTGLEFDFEYMASSQQHPRSKAPPYVKHQGILFSTARVSRETLKAMKTFEIRDDDVVIVSYPKSGMNWMFEVVHKILVRKENSSPIAPEMWPPDKEQPNYIQLRDSPSPRLMFTHLQPKMAPPGLAAPVNKMKAIVVLRNPKDVCVSYYFFHQKNPLFKTPESWEQHNKDFLLGKMPFGDYFDHVLGWWQMRNDPHFLFVKYEDMKKDFRSSVKTIAAFLEKELTDEHLALILNSCSLESMRKTLAESGTWRKNVVRNGMVGDWKNHFSAEESARFDQKYRERMAGTGLEFEFE